MLQQPHQLRSISLGNRFDFTLHPRHRRFIGNEVTGNLPTHGIGILQFWLNGKAGHHFPSFPNFDN